MTATFHLYITFFFLPPTFPYSSNFLCMGFNSGTFEMSSVHKTDTYSILHSFWPTEWKIVVEDQGTLISIWWIKKYNWWSSFLSWRTLDTTHILFQEKKYTICLSVNRVRKWNYTLIISWTWLVFDCFLPFFTEKVSQEWFATLHDKMILYVL